MKNSKNKLLYIGPDYALSGDEQCVTLYKRRITKKGTEQYDAKGYFVDHKQALKRMVDMEFNQASSLEQIVKLSDMLKESIDSLCNECQKVPQTPSKARD